MLRRTILKIRRTFSATDTLKDELLNNPQFDKAFPHLAGYKEETRNPVKKEELDFIKSLL
jgi:hypothetical protein